jgi:hypothetical protein
VLVLVLILVLVLVLVLLLDLGPIRTRPSCDAPAGSLRLPVATAPNAGAAMSANQRRSCMDGPIAGSGAW